MIDERNLAPDFQKLRSSCHRMQEKLSRQTKVFIVQQQSIYYIVIITAIYRFFFVNHVKKAHFYNIASEAS